MNELKNKLKYIKVAIETTPNVEINLLGKIKELELNINKTWISLHGDGNISKHQYEVYPCLSERIGVVNYGIWNSTSAPTKTSINNIKIA